MLHPLGNKVVIRRHEKKEKTSGGIILPATTGERPFLGTVVSVGPGTYVYDNFVKPTVKVGDEVIFTKYAGTEVNVEDEEFLIVREEDILAVVEL